MKTIVIIESSDIGADYSAQAVIRLGFHPLFVCDMKNYQADTKKQILKYDFIDTPTSDAQVLTDVLKVKDGLSYQGVITFLDSRLEVAINLAQRLQCPGIDESIHLLKNKGAVAQLIPEYSPRTQTIRFSDLTEETLLNLLKSMSKGLIIKPAKTAGAIGLCIIKNREDIPTALSNLSNVIIPEFLDPTAWIAQEIIEGELVSVEGYAHNGEVTILGHCGRRKIGSTESIMLFPYGEKIHASAQKTCKEAVHILITRSGFKNGYFHTEFIIDGPKAFMIDSNVGRLGGGSIGQQLALAFEVNPIDVYTHVIELSLFGLNKPFTATLIPKKSTLGYMYGVETDTFLKQLTLPVLKSMHTQILDEEQIIPAMGFNNWAWLGIIAGETQDVIRDFSQISIETGEGVKRVVC